MERSIVWLRVGETMQRQRASLRRALRDRDRRSLMRKPFWWMGLNMVLTDRSHGKGLYDHAITGGK